MEYHQLKLQFPGNNDPRHNPHSTRTLEAEQTYGVNKIFTEPVLGMTPAAGGGFTTSTALHGPNFNANKWLSIVVDNSSNNTPVIQGYGLRANDIVLFTNQTGNEHLHGFYIVLNSYYRVSTGVWANSGQYTYAIDMQRLSTDMNEHPTSQYKSDRHLVLENDVSSALGGGATWSKDEFGADMFTFDTHNAVIRRRLASGTVFESVSVDLGVYLQFLLTNQDDPTRNGYYSNHSQFLPYDQRREFRRFPKFEYGTGSTLYVYGNVIEISADTYGSGSGGANNARGVGANSTYGTGGAGTGARVSAEATKATGRSVIEFIPDNILYKVQSDDIMQKLTVNYTFTRLRGVDGRVTWKAPASGPQTLEYFGNVTHPNSLYKSAITYTDTEHIIDGTRGKNPGPNSINLITGMPTPVADGVYLFKGVVDAASPYMKVQYERVDGYNSTDVSATGNASYLAGSNSGQQYTVEVTHPDASKTYLQTSDNYVPGFTGGVTHLTEKPTLYAALTGTAPAVIKRGDLTVGRQFTSDEIQMTHTMFSATLGTNVAYGYAYDSLIKRGLAVVLERDVLPHNAHSASGAGSERLREPHFHIYTEADEPFSAIERHNVHYKSLRIPSRTGWRYVYEDTGKDISDEHAKVIGKCSITLNFRGFLL